MYTGFWCKSYITFYDDMINIGYKFLQEGCDAKVNFKFFFETTLFGFHELKTLFISVRFILFCSFYQISIRRSFLWKFQINDVICVLSLSYCEENWYVLFFFGMLLSSYQYKLADICIILVNWIMLHANSNVQLILYIISYAI